MNAHEERDVLVARIVERRADAEDWRRFDLSEDPALVAELIESLREDAALRAIAGAAAERADSVALPRRRGPARRSLAAAAAILLAVATGFVAGRGLDPARPESSGGTRAPAAAPTGELIETLPARVVDARWLEDLEVFEIVELRRSLVRRRSAELYIDARDDAGARAPVRLDPTAITPSSWF